MTQPPLPKSYLKNCTENGFLFNFSQSKEKFQASKTSSFLDLRSFALRDIMTAGPI